MPIDTDENAQIEIVAPVLQKGNAKWRGIYKGETINFSMNDPDFKEAVLAKQISFKNGDVIVCVLDIHRELNEIGEVKPKDYIVRIVLDKHENGVLTETSEGKKYRREKKYEIVRENYSINKLLSLLQNPLIELRHVFLIHFAGEVFEVGAVAVFHHSVAELFVYNHAAERPGEASTSSISTIRPFSSCRT